MKSPIYLTQTKLAFLGKEGATKPDADGYYTWLLGGLDVGNENGIHYAAMPKVVQLFNQSSILRRRAANGTLRAEVGHPEPLPGESEESYMRRLMDIDLNNVAAHFKDVWLDEHYGRNNPKLGKPGMVAIMGLVKPSGVKKDILLEAIRNPHENIYFSIRALCEQWMSRGRLVRALREIVTIDLVNEGGMQFASKWDSPATESMYTNSVQLTQELIARAMKRPESVAMESSQLLVEIQDTFFKTTTKPIWTRY